MKRLLLCIAIFSLTLPGCKRDSPLRKLIEGAPAGATIEAVPVNAVQAFHQLQRDVISLIAAITTRTSIVTPTYPEFQGQTGPTYQFTVADDHFGQATVSFYFRNGSNTTIDPLGTQASTSTIKSVAVSITSSGPPFGGSGSLALTLDVEGDVNSILRSTGSYTFTSTDYTVIFILSPPGATATFTGLSGGTIDISGSGPGSAPISGAVTATTVREFNGSILWDNNNGEIHIRENGDALLLLNNLRYFFD